MITQRMHIIFDIQCGPYTLAMLTVTAVTPAEALRALVPVLEAAALAAERFPDSPVQGHEFRIVVQSRQWVPL